MWDIKPKFSYFWKFSDDMTKDELVDVCIKLNEEKQKLQAKYISMITNWYD
jgi:hypothetical protein